jgi:hypothetical protein
MPMTKDQHPATARWRTAQRVAETRKRNAAVKAALTDERIRERLKLTEEELDILDSIITDPKRYSGNQLLALKLKIMATVEPPTQKVSGDIGVQVVVNTMRRAEYELPAGSSTSSLPEKR